MSIDSGYDLIIYDLDDKTSLNRFEILKDDNKNRKIKQIYVSKGGDIILLYFDYDPDTDAIEIWVDDNKFNKSFSGSIAT